MRATRSNLSLFWNSISSSRGATDNASSNDFAETLIRKVRQGTAQNKDDTYFSRISTLGSKHTTAPVLAFACSSSNSALVLTSINKTLILASNMYSCRSFGVMVFDTGKDFASVFGDTFDDDFD
jgi:hypothetical protein